MKIEYMSDEYLMNMVEAIEAHDMVSAPPDLESEVLSKLGLTKRSKPEFRIYCFKVIGASAAAILIALSLPILSSDRAPTPTKQEVVGTAGATDLRWKGGILKNLDRGLLRKLGSSKNVGDYIMTIN